MNWQSFYVLLSVLPCIILVWLAWLGWRRRHTAGAPAFIVLMLSVAIWSLFHALELASNDLSTIIFWEKMKYFGIVTIPVAWLAFTSQYTGADRWLNARALTLLALFPTMTLTVVWTNGEHQLMWEAFSLDDGAPFDILVTTPGIWFAPHVIYSYSLILIGAILLIRFAIGSPEQHRKQTIAILSVIAISLLGNIISLLNIGPVQYLDITPLFFTAGGLVMALALLRFDLLDVVPVAYYSVFEQLSDGVVIVDSENIILDVNPIICTAYGFTSPSAVLGKELETVLPELPDRVKPASAVPGTQTVIKHNDQFFEIRVSP